MRELVWHVEQSMAAFTDSVFLMSADKRSSSAGVDETGSIVMAPRQPNRMLNPLLCVEMGELQGLMDAMWTAGIRPNNGEGSVGQLGATERHLADMKAIVMHKLGVTK